MYRTGRFLLIYFCVIPAILFVTLSCSRNSPLNPLPYVPVIKFSGAFADGDEFSWKGNRSNPNRCYLFGDTLMMYFFSEDYQESPRQGDQLRLEVFRVDSGGFITTHGIYFHLSRYSTGPTNLTYEVVPSDTLGRTYSLSMKVVDFSFQSGAAISLNNIGVTARVLGQGTLPCTITMGTITGNVE
jgi:hypothetical protein